jgi:hypothetical protein
MLIARRTVSILTLCGLLALAWYSVLLARADISSRENTPAALRTAVRLVPANAAFHALLAEHLEATGENPDEELEIATSLSPYESRYWIRRGFRAEVERKYQDSERYLLEAYRVDRGFDPRWALMNYYFRSARPPEFWKSTREALDMSYGDLAPIFRLCLAASDDPSTTQRILPLRREILFAFFVYLIEHDRAEAAAVLAAELASGAQPSEVPVLLDYSGRQMGHNDASSLTVWNALCRRRLLPFVELAPDQGKIVTNSDFAAAPLQKGFDWKYGTEPGVAVGPMDAAQGVSIEVTGKQADSIRLLEQEIPLTPGKQYVIHYEYRLIGNAGDSGVHWGIQGPKPDDPAGKDSLAISSVLSARDWDNGQMMFSAGQHDSASLVLEYRRALGTIRWKGTVQIRRVTSELARPELARPELVPPGLDK